MKKLIICFIAVSIAQGLHSQNIEKATGPKALNYKEVFSEIEYPKASKMKGEEGQVMLTIWITKDGELHAFEVDNPSVDLAKAIEDVIENLTFSPGINDNGEKVAGKIKLPIQFHLTI